MKIFCIFVALVTVVGREGVLSSAWAGETRCGRRLVSGLFTRPRLPLGYSYVATVPAGACRLNVSEILPTENYIALKLTNGSYIINGEFAVSAPGTYDAAGGRFLYTRTQSRDSVFALGPIQNPVDIMVLYTQPNPSIKYEYLTDSPPDDTSNDIPPVVDPQPHHHQMPRHHRHHSAESHTRSLERPKSEPSTGFNNDLNRQSQEVNAVGDRKFVWKLLSFTQCSRSCGGGLQIGKFRCVEISDKEDKEVSPAHCTGTPPPSRRRRCGAVPCPPRWRAAPWGPCPLCGPAHKTRIVGCVQDHARGIIKISNQKCPLPMPPSSEVCDIPNCDGTAITTESPRVDARRQVRPKDRIDTFRDGPVISLAANNTLLNDIGPTVLPSYSFSAAGGWLYTDWSECMGHCVGGGVQTRAVRCSDPAGCSQYKAPITSQRCQLRKHCDAQWFTSEWSACTASCGGRQIRGVICIAGNGRRLKDSLCRGPKPEGERDCGGDCATSWYLSDWSECRGPCEAGVQARTVWCTRGGAAGGAGATQDSDCVSPRPPARRSCVPPRCSSRPAVKPSVIAAATDYNQRVTRHQSHNSQNVRERPPSSDKGECIDKLNNCALAVQARLCHYPYYADFCCHSCHGR